MARHTEPTGFQRETGALERDETKPTNRRAISPRQTVITVQRQEVTHTHGHRQRNDHTCQSVCNYILVFDQLDMLCYMQQLRLTPKRPPLTRFTEAAGIV